MDAFAFCAEQLRQHDRDRFLADLFAPEASRRYLFALHAFNLEIARVRDLVSSPLPGEMRLQWWRDVIAGQAAGDAAGNPVAAALLETISLNGLPLDAFERFLEASVFDLYDDPMPSLTDLEGYAGETSSMLLQCGAMILAGGKDPGTAEAAGHGGVALAITGLLRALPVHSRRHQLYLPADRIAACGVEAADIFAGRVTPQLRSLLADVRGLARWHLDAARRHLKETDRAMLPAFLPLALVEPLLAKMEKSGHDPLSTTISLSPWLSQWTLWRAARRGGV